MKLIVTILFFCIGLIAAAQFPNTQFLGNASTIVEVRAIIRADSGYMPAAFTDTVAANAGAVDGIPGIQIRTGNNYWMRNSTANRWILFATNANYSFSNLLTESPTGQVKFGGIATANTLANLATFRLGIDSGNVVIVGRPAVRSDTLFAVETADGNIFLRVSASSNTVFMDQVSMGGGIFLQTGAATNILNGGNLAFSGNGFMSGFQQKVKLVRNYPLTTDSIGFMIANDTTNAKNRDSAAYLPFVIKFTSFVDNLERTKFSINGAGKILFAQVITAGGTTGDQTINAPAGTVNIAAAGTSVTVTNSLVSTSSTVYAVIRSNDATARIANVVPGSGSFVIHLTAAATAETSIGWVVFN